MKRSLVRLLSLVAVMAVLTGCTKQCFLSESDFNNASSTLLPTNLETDANLGVTPINGYTDPVATVDSPDRELWNLSLEQALAIALENGTVSDRTGQGGTGIANDQLFTFNGSSIVAQSDRIRVLAMNPALSAAGIEQALARFDPQWVTTMNWSATDELQQGLSSFSNGQNASFATTLVKGLSTGGVISTAFQQDYRDLVRPPTSTFGVINPQYTSRFILGFEQPLWRDYGTEINQLLARFPAINGASMPSAAAAAFNNKLLPLNQGSQLAGSTFFTDGILIARIRFDSQRAEFERNVNSLVLNTEIAYWKLYQAYGNLYAFEEVMRIAHKVWMNYKAKYEAGQKGLADFAPIRAQYEEFRGERLKALGTVLEAERNLRRIMGIPVEDGKRIVPIKAPTLAPYQPNWEAAQKDALALRPELVVARENLRLAQLNLITQKNFLKPDLRFNAQYQPLGFGTTLQGSDNFVDATGTPRPSNALRSLTSDHFNNWTIGLGMSVPLGFRLEHAAVRAAKLNLAQSYEVLKDQEDRIKSVLSQQYQKISEWHRRIEATTAERRAYGDAVNVRFRELEVGKTTVADFLLDVQRRFALALTKEYEAISEYNNTLARFEWAKGTLLPFNNISISEGPLPECVQKRAVENERERTNALVLKERPAPMTHPARLIGNVDGAPQTLTESLPLPSSVPASALPLQGSKGDDFGTPSTATPDSVPTPQSIPAPAAQPEKLTSPTEKSSTNEGKRTPLLPPLTREKTSTDVLAVPATSGTSANSSAAPAATTLPTAPAATPPAAAAPTALPAVPTAATPDLPPIPPLPSTTSTTPPAFTPPPAGGTPLPTPESVEKR